MYVDIRRETTSVPSWPSMSQVDPEPKLTVRLFSRLGCGVDMPRNAVRIFGLPERLNRTIFFQK